MGRAVLLVAILGTPAAADPVLSPITNRNYSIDLYDGVPLGNSATIAMGGASVADATGSSGTLVNPSAMAVRPTTDTDWWSWDYHLGAALSHPDHSDHLTILKPRRGCGIGSGTTPSA